MNSYKLFHSYDALSHRSRAVSSATCFALAAAASKDSRFNLLTNTFIHFSLLRARASDNDTAFKVSSAKATSQPAAPACLLTTSQKSKRFFCIGLMEAAFDLLGDIADAVDGEEDPIAKKTNSKATVRLCHVNVVLMFCLYQHARTRMEAGGAEVSIRHVACNTTFGERVINRSTMA